MMKLRLMRIVLDRRTVIASICFVSIVMLIDTNSQSRRLHWNAFLSIYTSYNNIQVPLSYASFLVLRPHQNESSSTQKQSAKMLEELAAKIRVPPCGEVHTYHFYVLKYAEPLNTDDFVRYLNQSFAKCAQPVKTIVHKLVIPDRKLDWQFVRDRVLDAYLDLADIYHIQMLTEDTAAGGNIDLQSIKDTLFQRSPHGVGVVVNWLAKTKSILSISFSKIHLEIFGGAFPVTIGSLERAFKYISAVYESRNLATFRGKIKNDSQGDQRSNKKQQEDLANQTANDLSILDRYLKAAKSAGGSWRAINPSVHNIIAMSLYGEGRRYTIGALRNAQLFPVIFPGWRLWFYCEKPPQNGTREKYGKVPAKIIKKLTELGAEIKYVDVAETGLAPMLWRFMVAEDPEVDVFTVRDCDSRLTERDQAVVSEWLQTNASFHCIRDHPSHSHYSVSGGLWGGRPRGLYKVFNGTLRTVMKGYGAGYVADMHFLGQKVWPLVQSVAFCHDSFSCQSFPSSHRFPVERIEHEHLGQVYDENSVGRQGDINILARAKINENCVPKKTP